jgi:hypothetical protein
MAIDLQGWAHCLACEQIGFSGNPPRFKAYNLMLHSYLTSQAAGEWVDGQVGESP